MVVGGLVFVGCFWLARITTDSSDDDGDIEVDKYMLLVFDIQCCVLASEDGTGTRQAIKVYFRGSLILGWVIKVFLANKLE